MTASRDKQNTSMDSFSLLLYPHRSLSPHGFLILISFVCVISFSAGLMFLMMGAWPIVAFFVLDAVLIYLAFKSNFKTGRRYEIIEIKNDKLTVRKIGADKQERCKMFEAYWARPVIDSEKLLIKCRDDTVEIGEFLILEEKQEVLREISEALRRFKNPVYT